MSRPPLFMMSPPRTRPPWAFTLVELLVSITVLTLLVAMLSGVLNSAVANWQRGETRADAFREARAALALIARDLAQTIAPPGNVPALVLDRHPDDGAGSPTDDPNEQAHCLTLASNPGKSALCAISYSCRWDPYRPPNGGVDQNHGTWTLARRLVNSDDLFVRFKAASSPFKFLDVFKRDPAPLSAADDIAAYIWDLEFRVPQNLAAAAPAPGPNVPSPGTGTYKVAPPYADRLPAYIEVRFKALSAAAGARLRGSATKATWTNPQDRLYQSVVLPNSQQFIQRVPLGAAPAPTP